MRQETGACPFLIAAAPPDLANSQFDRQLGCPHSEVYFNLALGKDMT